MEAPRFRLSNFVQARASSMAKFEIVGKTVTYDPRSPSASKRAEGLVSRANRLGVSYLVEATPQGTKITFTGRRKDVRRVFDPTIRSSTRRSSSTRRRNRTRHRNRA